MKTEEKTINEKIVDIVKLLDKNQILAVKFDKFMNKTEFKALSTNFTQVIFDDINRSSKGNLCIIDNVDLICEDTLFDMLQDKCGKFIFLFRNNITRKVFAKKGSKFYGIPIYYFGCKTQNELNVQVEYLFNLYKIKNFGDNELKKIINLSDYKEFYIEKLVKEIVLERIKNPQLQNDELIILAYKNIYNENILKHEIIISKAQKKAYCMEILIALANNINPYNAIDMVAGNTAKYIAMLENDGLVDSELFGVSKFMYKIADPFFKEYLRINFDMPEIKGYFLRQNKRF